jgi:hypothetical protein
VRRHVVRWFRMQRLLDGDAAADMLAWENSGFITEAGPIRRILTHVLLHTEWRTARTAANPAVPGA